MDQSRRQLIDGIRFPRPQSLADAKGVIVWDLSVDSTVCRAHQHAAGARKQGDLRKEPPGGGSPSPVIS